MDSLVQQTTGTDHPQVVFVWSTDPTAGAPHQIMAALWLARSGYKLLCVAEGAASVTQVPFPTGVLATRLIPRGTSRLNRAWWHAKLAIHLLTGRFGQYRNSLFYVQGHTVAAAVLLALFGMNRRRVVYHTQDFLEPGRHRLWQFLERRLARRAGVVLVNEPNRGRFMASHYQLSGTPTVVRTALPTAWPWPEFDLERRASILQRLKFNGPSEQARLIVHYGPLNRVRCGSQIAQAIAKLPANYMLVVTGVSQLNDGDTMAIASEAGIQDRVFIFPLVNYEELQEIGAACDIGLLLYPDDGIGNFYQAPGRLSEYLRAGLAIVSPCFPSMELLNLQLSFGATCDPMSPQHIAEAILSLGDKPPAQRRSQYENNLKAASTVVCYEAEAGNLLCAVRRLIGPPSACGA